MGKSQELFEIFTSPHYEASYASAKATGRCIRCRQAATFFRNASARLEYDVSALCQGCQDECLISADFHPSRRA